MAEPGAQNLRTILGLLSLLAFAGPVLAQAGDDNVCTVTLSGKQDIWTYMPRIEHQCSVDNILEMFVLPGDLAQAEGLAAIVCRFDRAIVIPPNESRDSNRTAMCVYRGSARTMNGR